MFTIPKEIITYLDTFKTNHGGTLTFMTAVFSLIAISKSMLNTWSLNQQANLQRQIENNRYKLELFDKMFKVYSDFSDNVYSSEFPYQSINTENLKVISQQVHKNLDYARKSLVLYDDINSLNKFYSETEKMIKFTSKILSYKNTIDRSKKELEIIQGNISIGNHTFFKKKSLTDQANLKIISINQINAYLNEDHDNMINFPREYHLLRNECEKDMKFLLSVPKQAYEEQSWFFVTWYREASTFRIKHPVMFYVAVICVLLLGALLCW